MKYDVPVVAALVMASVVVAVTVPAESIEVSFGRLVMREKLSAELLELESARSALLGAEARLIADFENCDVSDREDPVYLACRRAPGPERVYFDEHETGWALQCGSEPWCAAMACVLQRARRCSPPPKVRVGPERQRLLHDVTTAWHQARASLVQIAAHEHDPEFPNVRHANDDPDPSGVLEFRERRDYACEIVWRKIDRARPDYAELLGCAVWTRDAWPGLARYLSMIANELDITRDEP